MAAKKDEKATAWENQKVRITLFFDGQKYKDDVTVSVNGKSWRIQRGKEVEVPLYVWQVIKHGLAQDVQTAIMIQKKAEELEKKEKKFAW